VNKKCDEWFFLFPKVMASKTKIYVVMEYVTGGELFNKIVSTIFSLG
jgi:serine/threonine protein kinase